MVKESMLTKDEKQWLKVCSPPFCLMSWKVLSAHDHPCVLQEHNQRCYEKLLPLVKDDKRAVKWLKREAERGIGLAPAPGGFSIEWD